MSLHLPRPITLMRGGRSVCVEDADALDAREVAVLLALGWVVMLG